MVFVSALCSGLTLFITEKIEAQGKKVTCLIFSTETGQWISTATLLFFPTRAILVKDEPVIIQKDLFGLTGVHQLHLVAGQRMKQIKLIKFNHISLEFQ